MLKRADVTKITRHLKDGRTPEEVASIVGVDIKYVYWYTDDEPDTSGKVPAEANADVDVTGSGSEAVEEPDLAPEEAPAEPEPETASATPKRRSRKSVVK